MAGIVTQRQQGRGQGLDLKPGCDVKVLLHVGT